MEASIDSPSTSGKDAVVVASCTMSSLLKAYIEEADYLQGLLSDEAQEFSYRRDMPFLEGELRFFYAHSQPVQSASLAECSILPGEIEHYENEGHGEGGISYSGSEGCGDEGGSVVEDESMATMPPNSDWAESEADVGEEWEEGELLEEDASLHTPDREGRTVEIVDVEDVQGVLETEDSDVVFHSHRVAVFLLEDELELMQIYFRGQETGSGTSNLKMTLIILMRNQSGQR